MKDLGAQQHFVKGGGRDGSHRRKRCWPQREKFQEGMAHGFRGRNDQAEHEPEKKKGSLLGRLRQGNTQRGEGGHISRNHKVYFGEGFYTSVSFRSRDEDFTKKSHRAGSLHCKNTRQGGNILLPMLIIINFWTTSRLTYGNLQLWVSQEQGIQ